jgi:hypothetical protein
MTCRDFDEIVHGLVRLELLDVGLREEALEHAARCSQCEESMAQARLLAEATELAARGAQEYRASPRVDAALLTAFRSRHRRATWWRTLEWATAAAAAVALAGFFWIAPYRSKQPTAPAPGRGVSSQPRGPQYASGPDLPSPDSQDSELETNVVRVAASGGYAAGDFVLLPFAGGIEPEDAGMVVRLQLTPASLAELGYPIAEATDEELVRADVLVGEDGWPRAVRLVQ